ncbi:MAG: phosphopantothenate/pantothenate synthetase [Promethearchaeota archaeon]|nr:MAG: phosphopantothenate/pantothenate synthetase [Candidatus Lokiarchaeota archaeon]
MEHIPQDHPRAESLRIRQKIIDGLHHNMVVEAGLIAHGRGEAFDYLIGEKTNQNAIDTMKIAVAMLLTANHPILSINGNVAALCSEDMVKLSEITRAQLEINLFYGKPGRIEAITNELRSAGATDILGTRPFEESIINDLSSNRRYVDPNGIKLADVVLVPLEDGDRTEALKKEGKVVITIDLNPLSRTAQQADVTIVDNIIRVIPKMCEIAQTYKEQIEHHRLSLQDLEMQISKFSNTMNLERSLQIISTYLESKVMCDKN